MEVFNNHRHLQGVGFCTPMRYKRYEQILGPEYDSLYHFSRTSAVANQSDLQLWSLNGQPPCATAHQLESAAR